MVQFFKSRSIQVFLTSFIYLILAKYLPNPVHQGFYTISCLIKDLLLWMLPITIGFFIAHAIASFEKKAIFFVLTLFLFEAISNSCSVWYAYGCGHLTLFYLDPIKPQIGADLFSPLFKLPFTRPVFWTADKGTFLGIFLGLLAGFTSPQLRQFLTKGKLAAETILTRFFAPLIPLFILGFLARMYKTEILQQLSTQCSALVLSLSLFLIAYIAFLFLLGNGPNLPSFSKRVKNLLPTAGIAFSSGCSLSTMPWTIEGTSKNLKHPDLAKSVIPATTNIQQIGDCIVNSFLCFVIYYQFNGHSPDFGCWALFSAVFVLARFATAAVLGGAIFIMLPIYETYLGFTPEMIATILAFNVLLDPIVTCSNVVANGALCRLFEKSWLFWLPSKVNPLQTDD